MIQAIEKHGFKGSDGIGTDFLRCHPWSEIGKDPVPGSLFFKEIKIKKNHSRDSFWCR